MSALTRAGAVPARIPTNLANFWPLVIRSRPSMETLSPSIVLAAYAESLLDGRRVAVFGDALSPCADELLERGARLVHLYDPDPARAAEAAARNRSKQISVLPLDTADIAVRDGAFDVAIITDLSTVDDGARLLKCIRRALSPRGVAIIASPNPDAKIALLPRSSSARAAVSYYDLFDAVSAEFPEVRMLGQTPFVGYAVVDFSPEGEPDVSLDSGLVPGGAEEPEWFVVVASASPVEVEAFSIVQLPAARVVRSGVSGGGDPRIAEELRAARANEARLVEHVATLEAEVGERRAAGAAPPPEASLQRARALEAELLKRDAWIREIEARATAADARADGAQGEIDALREKQKQAVSLDAARADLEKRAFEYRAEKERLEKRLAEQGTEKEHLEKRLAEQGTEKEHLAKRLAEQGTEKERLAKRTAEHIADKDGLEKRLAQRDLDVERLTAATAGEGPDAYAALEAALKDRGERIRKLESDLREAERVGKELVRELQARANGGSDAARREPAVSPLLSGENARLKADLEAAGWTIQELEGRLSPAAAHTAPAPPR